MLARDFFAASLNYDLGHRLPNTLAYSALLRNSRPDLVVSEAGVA